MTTTTVEQRREDTQRGLDILESVRESITTGKALVNISTEYGKSATDYLRVSVYYPDSDGNTQHAHLTWAIAKASGYTLKDRGGRWFLAISGGGYSKSYEIALLLARHYGVEKIRYEDN